jgi:hypothetical protein
LLLPPLLLLLPSLSPASLSRRVAAASSFSSSEHHYTSQNTQTRANHSTQPAQRQPTFAAVELHLLLLSIFHLGVRVQIIERLRTVV